MSNNISRKGLAWGALVAIAASLFATAPAHAAAGVTLNANTTSQVLNVPNGTSFTLVETASSEIPTSSYGTLAFSVVNNNAGAGVVTVGGRTTQSFATTDARVTFTAAQVAASSNNVTIEVRSTSSATASYTVTSWLDANNNGVVDNGEYSASQTITFKSAADLSAATTTSFVSAPTYTNDARSLSVRVAFDSTMINNDQLAGSTQQTRISNNVSVDVRVGTYDARLVPATNAAAVVGSGDARFYANTGTNANPTNSVDISDGARVWYSGAVFTAQAYWGTTAIGAKATTASGLINNQATAVSVDVVKGANATLKDVNNSASVRLNSAFQVSATIRGDAGVLAGQAVKFGVSSANWVTGTIRVTVNGTTYATSADLRAATWSVTSDASGNAVLNVSVAGANVDALNDIVFTATSANIVSVSSVRVSQTKAVATTLAATPVSQAVVLGSAATVVSTIKDQFGQLIADTNYAVKVSYDSTGSTAGSSASGSFNNIVNGSATSAVTVDGTVTGTTHYNVNAVTVAADGSQTGVLSPVGLTIVTRAASDLVVGYVVNVVTTGTHEAVDTKALAGAAGDATSAVSVTGRAVITGDRGVPYAKVTITGAGLFVLDTTAGTYAAAPFVVTADANGYFTATIRSNTSGTVAGTVASGSATAVAFNVLVDAPLVANGTQIAVANPASAALAGADVLVTFSVRDVFGNTVASYPSTQTLTVHVSGDITRDVTAVDSKGFANLVLNLASTGTAYVTATFSNDARLLTTQVRVDWAKAVVTVTLPDTITAGQNADVVVTVTDPAGNALSGKTVSATSNGVGYLTVASGTTDSNGQATLKLYANENELGWAYITATSSVNSVSATSDASGVQVVAPEVVPTATDSVASIALDVPATAQAGTVVDVVATATDADGNPVTGAVVAATSTGVGYLAINGGTTDANGQVVLKLVISGGENGTASVVATAGTAQSDAAQVTAGVTDANITLNKKRVTVDWSFAANKKVVIVRDGVAIKSFTASSNAADSFSFNLKTGTHKVSVKVGGVTLDSQSYKIAK